VGGLLSVALVFARSLSLLLVDSMLQRSRSRSRSGSRKKNGNPRPSGSAAEKAIEGVLDAAAMTEGFRIYRGDPQNKHEVQTKVDFYINKSNGSYITLQHKASEIYKHLEEGRKHLEPRVSFVPGRAGNFGAIKVNYLLFTVTERVDSPIEWYLLKPSDNFVRRRTSIKCKLSTFRSDFKDYKMTLEEVVLHLKSCI